VKLSCEPVGNKNYQRAKIKPKPINGVTMCQSYDCSVATIKTDYVTWLDGSFFATIPLGIVWQSHKAEYFV